MDTRGEYRHIMECQLPLPGSICMFQPTEEIITIEDPIPGINHVTYNPQGKHANHYTKGDRQSI